MNNREMSAGTADETSTSVDCTSVTPQLQQCNVSSSLDLVSKIPEIHKEILLFAKTKTKDEVLKAYPNYAGFISTIRGF